jgi:hypothetical protein
MLEQNPHYMLEGRDLGSPIKSAYVNFEYLPTEPT